MNGWLAKILAVIPVAVMQLAVIILAVMQLADIKLAVMQLAVIKLAVMQLAVIELAVIGWNHTDLIMLICVLQIQNTFILALDGDVDFKLDAVRLLVDGMRT